MRAGWPCATAKRRGLARSFIHRACGSLAMAGCVMILDAAHSSTTRCVMPLCVKRVTAQREPTRGSWVRHETDIGTGENEGTSHNVSSYLRYTNILMISMPEGEVNSQRPLFFTPSTILVQLCLGVVHSLLGQYINVLQYNTRVSVLY